MIESDYAVCARVVHIGNLHILCAWPVVRIIYVLRKLPMRSAEIFTYY